MSDVTKLACRDEFNRMKTFKKQFSEDASVCEHWDASRNNLTRKLHLCSASAEAKQRHGSFEGFKTQIVKLILEL